MKSGGWSRPTSGQGVTLEGQKVNGCFQLLARPRTLALCGSRSTQTPKDDVHLRVTGTETRAHMEDGKAERSKGS